MFGRSQGEILKNSIRQTSNNFCLFPSIFTTTAFQGLGLHSTAFLELLKCLGHLHLLFWPLTDYVKWRQESWIWILLTVPSFVIFQPVANPFSASVYPLPMLVDWILLGTIPSVIQSSSTCYLFENHWSATAT